jgi:hypothetical protein
MVNLMGIHRRSAGSSLSPKLLFANYSLSKRIQTRLRLVVLRHKTIGV